MIDKRGPVPPVDLKAGPRNARGLMALAVVPLLSALWKLILVARGAFPFNSDEAIVALMARHIHQGQLPLFFYGQAYLGSLDALLAAIGFALLGERIIVIRLIQLLLFALTIATAMAMAQRWKQDWFITTTAGLLLAFPTVNVMLYSTVSLGGYGEALLIGNLLVLFGLAYWEGSDRPWVLGVWAFLAGFGWWAFGLTLIYSLPTGTLVLAKILKGPQKRGREVALLLAAGMAGALPWFIGLSSAGWQKGLQEITGSAIAGASSGNILVAILEHIRNLLVFGPSVILGIRPPWSTEIPFPQFAVFVLALWLILIVTGIARLYRDRKLTLFTGIWLAISGLNLAGFILTPFGADPTGRYFLPLAVPLAILAGSSLSFLASRTRWVLAAAGLALLVGYNISAVLFLAGRSPPGLTTQFDAVARIDHSRMGDLIEFLLERDERYGYTNYWVSYPLAFRSEEELIYIPALPYHHDFRFAPRDSRYAPYEEEVGASDRVAYITTNHPQLDDEIGRGLRNLGIDYQVQVIGPYKVFYGLDRHVRPNQLNLPQGQADG